jgi:hypothetical protein
MMLADDEIRNAAQPREEREKPQPPVDLPTINNYRFFFGRRPMISADVDAYNSISRFEDMSPLAPSAVIRMAGLRGVFETHGLAPDVGISLLHRHFRLGIGNVLGWKVQSQRLISSIHAVQLETHIPLVWRVFDGNVLAPLEFVDPETLGQAVKNRIELINNSRGLCALARQMSKISANGTFAISLMPMLITHIASETRIARDSVKVQERSDFEKMSSTVTLCDGLSQEGVDTLWILQENRGFVVAGQCQPINGCRGN